MSIITVGSFSHVSTRVSNIDKTLQFYRDTLGLEVIFDIELPGGIGRAVGCKTVNDGAIEFVELSTPEGGTVPVDGSGDTAMTAFSVDDIQATYLALKAAGVNPPEPFSVEGVTMMFIPDPDGRNVEIAEFSGAANTVVELHKA